MNPKDVLFHSSYSFGQTELQKGQTCTLAVDVPTIVFNLSAEFFLIKGENERLKIRKEEMLCLSPDMVCTIKTIHGGSICLLGLPDAFILYYRYIRSSFKDKRPDIQTKKSILKMDQPLAGFLRTMSLYEKDEFLTEALFQIKAAEFFCILKASYRIDILSSFFGSVLTAEHHFIALVMLSYKEVKTVQQLAARCHLSLSAFKRMFHQIFQDTPYNWMIKEKSKQIYKAIYETPIPLKEIADEFGFSSLPQFIDFCKKHIGITPGEIRKKRTSSVIMN